MFAPHATKIRNPSRPSMVTRAKSLVFAEVRAALDSSVRQDDLEASVYDDPEEEDDELEDELDSGEADDAYGEDPQDVIDTTW